MLGDMFAQMLDGLTNHFIRCCMPVCVAVPVQAQKEYEAASASHKQLHKSVAAKEATKKWMKF